MKLPMHVLSLEDDIRDAALVQDARAADGINSLIRRVETETDFLAALERPSTFLASAWSALYFFKCWRAKN